MYNKFGGIQSPGDKTTNGFYTHVLADEASFGGGTEPPIGDLSVGTLAGTESQAGV